MKASQSSLVAKPNSQSDLSFADYSPMPIFAVALTFNWTVLGAFLVIIIIIKTY